MTASDTRTRRELRQQLDELTRDHSPLDPVPRLRGAHWVEPKVVIRVEFSDWTSDDLLRQAAFKGVEIGRDPRTVHRESAVETRRAVAAAERANPPPARDGSSAARSRQPRSGGSSTRRAKTVVDKPAGKPDKGRAGEGGAAASPAELKALDAMEKEGIWSVGGHEVRVTNLDKVLFPKDDDHETLTKRDMIRYYASVAATLIPYLRDHGLTVQRYPNGVAAKGFWQKDLPGHAPEWVQRWTFHHSAEGPKVYPVVDRVATLVWLAQEAAIELHPWTSTTDAPDTPSYALIDIDPGPSTTWDEVLVLGRLFRAALGHLGVRGAPKVTGKRGIQVWIGIEPKYSFDDTRDWVESLSRAIGSTVPDLVSWEWSKRNRGGKARLDFTQNAHIKTLVAPYSVRPAPGAPVSAPIRWEELDDPKLRPDRWTIRTLPARLAKEGDLFAPALDVKQELPSL